MTYDELKVIVNQMITDPTKAPEMAVTLLDEFKGMTNSLSGMQDQLAQSAKENEALAKTNMSMYLKMTGTKQEEGGQATEPEEKSYAEKQDDLINKVRTSIYEEE